MQYIIYCRKSSESEDRQVMSLDAQEQELLKIAQRSGLKIHSIMRESKSAKTLGRPLFAQMLGLLSSGEVQGILCWKIDRLARNFYDGGQIIDLLQKSVIREIRTHESTHLPNDNVFMISFQFGMANQYSRDLSENVKRGNKEKLRRGDWPNHAPIGYINDKATKTVVVDKSLKHFIVLAFEMYASGQHSFRSIANELHTQGLRSASGRKVLQSLIEKIIGRTFYYGMMERDGVLYVGNHEPIISKELYDKARQVREGFNRPRQKKQSFPYRGFMTCESCGCSLTATVKKGKYDYYYCTNGKGKCIQHKKYLTDSNVEKLFIDAIQKITFDEELVELMYQASKEKLGYQEDTYDSTLKNFDLEILRWKAKERKLLENNINEIISNDLYQEYAKSIKNEIITLEKQKADYLKKSHDQSSTLELTKEIFLQPIRAMSGFSEADIQKKRNIISNILWNLSIKDGETAQLQYKSPYDILAKVPQNAPYSKMLPDMDSNHDKRYQKPLSYH